MYNVYKKLILFILKGLSSDKGPNLNLHFIIYTLY